MAPAPPARRVLIPPDLPSAALCGMGSGLEIGRLEGTTMGTFWSVCCLIPPGISEEQTRRALEGVFAKVTSQMSHWDESSALCAFNRAAAGTWHPLPAEFYRVLSQAVEVAEASGGCCDPTVGEVVDLYGFGPATPGESPFDDEALQRASRHCGWKRLKLDPAHQAALQPGGLRLDLSAIAKGFAVDWAAESLEALGIGSYLMEIGGEVRGAGCKPDGEPWWCLLETPREEGGECLPQTIVALCGLSLATSGDTLRQRQVGGNMVSHLIDPRICRPAGRHLTSVSVFAPSCMTADAWATALFVAGPEEGRAMAEARHLAALFTCRTPEGLTQNWSPALAAMME